MTEEYDFDALGKKIIEVYGLEKSDEKKVKKMLNCLQKYMKCTVKCQGKAVDELHKIADGDNQLARIASTMYNAVTRIIIERLDDTIEKSMSSTDPPEGGMYI